jgi:hypothetical protein
MKHFRTFWVVALALLSAAPALSQAVVGTVRDADGEALPFTTVLADGGSVGSATDIDGAYRMDLTAGEHTLTFSFIGYKALERDVKLAEGQVLRLNIALVPDAVLVGDVVIVGYGVQRKKEVTGSIAQISSKQITAVKTPSFEAACKDKRRACKFLRALVWLVLHRWYACAALPRCPLLETLCMWSTAFRLHKSISCVATRAQ